MNMVFDRR